MNTNQYETAAQKNSLKAFFEHILCGADFELPIGSTLFLSGDDPYLDQEVDQALAEGSSVLITDANNRQTLIPARSLSNPNTEQKLVPQLEEVEVKQQNLTSSKVKKNQLLK